MPKRPPPPMIGIVIVRTYRSMIEVFGPYDTDDDAMAGVGVLRDRDRVSARDHDASYRVCGVRELSGHDTC